MADQPNPDAPRTAGELRRRLVEMGDPWTVDPRLEDGDPLPAYGRGGLPPEEDPALALAVEPERDISAQLRERPPSNPLVRARWIELGLLDEQ
jgi:hypothetical protein